MVSGPMPDWHLPMARRAVKLFATHADLISTGLQAGEQVKSHGDSCFNIYRRG